LSEASDSLRVQLSYISGSDRLKKNNKKSACFKKKKKKKKNRQTSPKDSLPKVTY